MSPSDTPNDEIKRVERRAQAIELRRQGKSYREIAAELGINVATAFSDVKAYFAEVVSLSKESIMEVRELELARLDRYLVALERHIDGDRICMGCGRPDVRAIEAAVKVGKSRREILGVDAPTKIQPLAPIQPGEDPATVRAKLVAALAEVDRRLSEPKEMH